MTANGHEVSFMVKEKALKLGFWWWLHNCVHFLKIMSECYGLFILLQWTDFFLFLWKDKSSADDSLWSWEHKKKKKSPPKKNLMRKKYLIAVTQMGEAWPFYHSWGGSWRASTITSSPGTGLSGSTSCPALPFPGFTDDESCIAADLQWIQYEP